MELSLLVDMILAAGALGTAAYGVVDGFKYSDGFASAGFARIQETMGANAYASLGRAYGNGYENLLRAQYLEGRKQGELVRTLRQGVRIGLNENNAAALADEVGVIEGEDLKAIATNIRSGEGLSDAQKNMLSRFELAVDARVDAAVALADKRYKSIMRFSASAAAIVFAFIGAFGLSDTPLLTMTSSQALEIAMLALVVGVAAVPLAPIAKDVAKAVQSAAKATRRRK